MNFTRPHKPVLASTSATRDDIIVDPSLLSPASASPSTSTIYTDTFLHHVQNSESLHDAIASFAAASRTQQRRQRDDDAGEGEDSGVGGKRGRLDDSARAEEGDEHDVVVSLDEYEPRRLGGTSTTTDSHGGSSSSSSKGKGKASNQDRIDDGQDLDDVEEEEGPDKPKSSRGRPKGVKDGSHVNKEKRGRPKGAKNVKGTKKEREEKERLALGLPPPAPKKST
ncbi:hypothetical protein MNV49_001533 [Pseudohyphozyma bogoriensis]|nr:hypothetical protein MNV49_001533 [Pseudohyphozyma bogoriensis]